MRNPGSGLKTVCLRALFIAAAAVIIPACGSPDDPATLEIVTILLNNTDRNIATTTTMAATGGQTPYSWSRSGGLPAGMTFSAAGVLSGTPTAAGTFPLVITVQDSRGFTASGNFSFVVAPPIAITTSSVPAGDRNLAYNATLGSSGGTAPNVWTTPGPLPAGMTLSAAGVLSGTPTVAGSFPFTATVTDAVGGTDSRLFTLIINPPLVITTASLPAGDQTVLYSWTFGVTGGTAPFTWSTASALPAGVTLSAAGVLGGTPGASGLFPLTITVTDFLGRFTSKNFNLTINPALSAILPAALAPGEQGVAYSVTFTVTGGTAPRTWTRTGPLPAGMALSAAGVLSGVPAANGTFNFTVTVSDAAGGSLTSGALSLVISPPITITTASLPGADRTVAYTFTLAATGGDGGPYTWSKTGALPAGITLSAAGVLSGTTTAAAASFPITIKAVDATGGSATKAFTFVLSNAIAVTTNGLPPGDQGLAYNIGLAHSGGTSPVAWSTPDPLPTGITLSAAGVLSGTATVNGSFPINVTVTDAAGGAATKLLTLLINPTLTFVTTTLAPAGDSGTFYTRTLAATGGTPPLTWSLTAGPLPAGLGLSAGGVLSGTPTAIGTFPITIQVRDFLNVTRSRNFNLVINASLVATTASLPDGDVGLAYSQTLTSSGGTAPRTWALTGGSLPAGLALSTGGVLSGTPLASGLFTPTFTVTDAAAASSSTGPLSLLINPAVSITTASLPGADRGVAYAFTMGATGGDGGPYTWTKTSGNFPSGLSIAANGDITGTTNAGAGNYTVTLKATDGLGGSATKTFILALANAIAITTASLPQGDQNLAYSQTFGASGGTAPFTWSEIGALPAGISLSTAGVLSGTPTVAGSFPINVTVTDAAGGTASKAFTLIINPPITITTTSLPAADQTVPYSKTLAATGGTGPLAWTTLSPLPDGLALSTAGVLSGTPTLVSPPGAYPITFTATDTLGRTRSKLLTLTLNGQLLITTVALPDGDQTVTYNVALQKTGGTAPFTWSKTAGSLPAGISLSTAGVLSGNPSVTGVFSLTFKVTDAVGGSATSASLSLTINPPLAIPTPSLPLGEVGVLYGFTIQVADGTPPYLWSMTAGLLPAGVVFTASGDLVGTPSASGSFPITVRVTDAAGGARSKGFTLTIRPQLQITTLTLPVGDQGRIYRATVARTGGQSPFSWGQSGALPTGITFSNGVFAGTPSVSGSFPITVTVSDPLGGSASQAYTLVINPPLTVDPIVLPAGTSGNLYADQTVTATGGTGSGYAWSFASGTLPSGMTFSPGGVLGGTPGQTGVFNFGVRVTDSAANTATRILTLSVGPFGGPVTIDNSFGATLPPGTQGKPYGFGFTALGGNPPFTWSEFGTLPTGMTLNAATGILSGTPTSNGFYSFDVTVTDGSTNDTKTFNLFVNPPMSISPPTLTGGDINVAFTRILSVSGGTAPYSWSIVGALPPGVGFLDGVFDGTPTAAGNFVVTVTVTDSAAATASRTYTLSIHSGVLITTTTLPQATEGRPYLTFLAATSGTPPYGWIQTGGSLPAGVGLAFGGDLGGAPAGNGSFNFDATVIDAAGGNDTKTLNLVVNPAVAISTLGLPDGNQGAPYSFALSSSGGTAPFTWTQTAALPTGMTFSTGGVLSGTPTLDGVFPLNFKVTDANGSTATLPLTLTINQGLVITTASLPVGTQDAAYPSTSLTAINGVPGYTWSSTALPAGLSLSVGGTLDGTPTVNGAFPVDFTVTDTALVSSTRTLTIILNPPVQVFTTVVAQGTVGRPYSFSLLSSGGTGPYTWTSGPLPFGLALSTAGELTGPPTGFGSALVDFTVTDNLGSSDTKQLNVTMNDVPQVVTASLPDGAMGVAYVAPQLAGTNGTTPYTWSLANGTNLPAGLSLSSDGFITGTPGAAGSTFDVQLTDFCGATDVRTLSIAVFVPPSFTSVPADGAGGVFLAANLVLTFNQAMDHLATEGAITYSVVTPLASPVPSAQYFWNATDDQLTIVFDTNGFAGIQGDDLLTEATTYKVTVGAGAETLGGTPLAADQDVQFSTIPDGTPPALHASTPFNPPITVLVPTGTTSMEVKFSETTMDNTQGNVTLEYGFNGTSLQGTVGGGGALGLTFVDDTLTIDFGGALPPRTVFRLRFNNFKDLAGHTFNSDDEVFFVTAAVGGADLADPEVVGTLPRNGLTGVSRDTAIFVPFTEPMHPDVVNHVTVTDGAGVPFAGIMTYTKRLNDHPFGIQIIPSTAFPADADVMVSWGSGATDTSGRPLVAGSSTFTVVGEDTTLPDVDPLFSSFPIAPVNTPVDVSPFGISSEIAFVKQGTSTRDYLSGALLSTDDIYVFDAVTFIPLKGFRVSLGESGGLQIDCSNNFSGMTPGGSYVLRLQPWLTNSSGIEIPQTDLPFTVATVDTRPMIIDRRTRFNLESGGLKVELQLSVFPGSSAITNVKAEEGLFSKTLTLGGSGDYEYGNGFEADLAAAGGHVLTYTVTDAAGHNVVIGDKGITLGGVPSLAGPPDASTTADLLPTYSWSGLSLPAGTDGIFLEVQEGGNTVFATVVAGNATSFTQPADYPLLPNKTFTWTVVAIRFVEAPLRGGDDQGAVADAFTFTTPVGPPTAPDVNLVTPGSSSGIVDLSYLLIDLNADVCSITAEFSVNGGGSFSPATMAGGGTSGLSASPAGDAHNFLWNSVADGVAPGGPVSTVQFRITPNDGALTGAAATTLDFTVDNSGVASGAQVDARSFAASGGRLKAMATDGQFLYLLGSESTATPGDDRWRIEKRQLGTLALVSGFGASGVVTWNPGGGEDSRRMRIIADSGSLYLLAAVETGLGTGSFNYYLEKRDAATGALDLGFNTTGTLLGADLGPGGPVSMAVDGTSIYLAMADFNGGDFQGRVDKRSKASGALDGVFGGATGTVVNNFDGDIDGYFTIAIDGSSMYLAGSVNGTFGGGGPTGFDVWVEKRSLATGAADGTFVPVVETLAGFSAQPEDIVLDGTSFYVFVKAVPAAGDATVHLEKRSMSTGALITSADTLAAAYPDDDDGMSRLLVSGGALYVASGEVLSPTDARWRLEKRDLTTAGLPLIGSFGTSGVAVSNPSLSEDQVFVILQAGGLLYVAGTNQNGGGEDWRIELYWP